jgi:hypothetical protein
MPKTLKRWMLMCGAAALLGTVMSIAPSEPAQAQFGISIHGIGINFGHRYRGPRYGSRHRAPRGKVRSNDDDNSSSNDNAGRSSKTETVLASLGAPSSAEQGRVLKGISASPVLGVVGSTKDLTEVGKPISRETERDYTAGIELIIKAVEQARDKRLTTPGDVTAHSLEQSLERAYKNAKLDEFERFLAESWTSERIRVMILNRVLVDLNSLIGTSTRGNTGGNAPMEALDSLVSRAAEAVYRRVFETSELLAASRASTQFIQRLYQSSAGAVDDRTREVADSLVKRGSSATIARYEGLLRSDENSYAYRYRAQRIIYDCLSKNMERLSSNETSTKTPEEMQNKITEISAETCDAWLAYQFGTPGQKLKPQPPMPLRAVWTEKGPKDDPSMYGRSLSTF